MRLNSTISAIMRVPIWYVVAVTAILTTTSSEAQVRDIERGHAAFIEVLGSGSSAVSLNFEYRVDDRFRARTGVGIGAVFYSIFDESVTIPLTVSYLLPPISDSKRFEVGIGTVLRARDGGLAEIPVIWSAILAYRFTPPSTGAYFRPVLTLSGPVGPSQRIVPLFGVAFGSTFKR